tara:strand:- start:352 stop:996 length:645 start_codon:yes stop_codon:yes gene_type:complete
MKICHRYRNVIDTSLEKYFDIKEWKSYDEDNKQCVIYVHENDKKKLAIKKVTGLFAKDIAYTFWSIDETVKLEWDQSVQSMRVLEVLSPNCAIIHLKMKRIWPIKARDCVCATEILQVGEGEWVVNNISVEHPLTKNIENDYVRMNCDVNMFVKEELINKDKPKTRDNIISTITYRANVDVGSWASNVVVSKMCHKTWSNVLEELCETVRNKYT